MSASDGSRGAGVGARASGTLANRTDRDDRAGRSVDADHASLDVTESATGSSRRSIDDTIANGADGDAPDARDAAC